MLIFLGKIFARKPSYDSESSSLATTSSEKLGGHQSDSSSSSVTDQVESREAVSEDTQVCCRLLGFLLIYQGYVTTLYDLGIVYYYVDG